MMMIIINISRSIGGVFSEQRPEQIVLVVDGPINDNIENIINDFYQLVKNKIEFDVIKLKDNLGHGLARKTCR